LLRAAIVVPTNVTTRDRNWTLDPGRRSHGPRAGAPMYIGIGTLVFILLILMIIYFLRRA
jgi:hypothetical protein